MRRLARARSRAVSSFTQRSLACNNGPEGLFCVARAQYSIDTPPEELQQNVPALRDNIDMKNISLQVTGGRSSVSGIRATVFGASGRLGKHIVNALGQIGSQVVVPYRGDGTEVHQHRLMGDLGQIVPLPYQIRDKRSVERVIKGSNVVINCISRRRESKNFTFHDTHVNSTHMIARTAAELGVDRLIQMSMANCSEDSPSGYHRTKWQAEQVARAFYPEATVIRPSVIYGYGDYWFERMGFQWGYPFKRQKIINPKQIIQPCHFLDVARAVTSAVLDPETTAGKTYSIYGPVTAKKSQFFHRCQEVLASNRIVAKVYREWNPKILAPFYKPIYPLQRQFQHWFDFYRWYHNIEFLSYEDLMLTMVDQYANYDENADLLTLEDLGLKPEDYFYWEAKCLEPFFDRDVLPLNILEMGRKNKTWGGQTPTSPFVSMHSCSLHGYRQLRKGLWDLDWWAFDSSPEMYSDWEQPKSTGIDYGHDVDGKDRFDRLVKQGKVGW